MIDRSPQVMCLAVDADTHLIKMPTPVRPVAPAYPPPPDLAGKQRTEAIPPIPTVSWQTSIPRSNSRSSTCLSDNGFEGDALDGQEGRRVCRDPGRSSRQPHRPADRGCPKARSPRSWHGASGRLANIGPTRGAEGRRSPCMPTAPPETAQGSPAPGVRCSPATAARSTAVRPAPPLRTRCRLRPPRR